MPQPIKRPCTVNFEGLTNLPDHAAMLGHIVALSSMVDSNLGFLLAYLSRTHASVAIAMFHAVNSTEAQRAMLLAAAQTQLAGAELDEFTDLMTDFRTQAGARNRLVHNIWGSSPEHPNKAIWCHAKDYTKLPVSLAVVETPEQLPLFRAEVEGQWRYCSTYTLKDLQDALQRLYEFSQHVRAFIVRLLEGHPQLLAVVEAFQPPKSEQVGEPPAAQDQGNPHQSGQSDPQVG